MTPVDLGKRNVTQNLNSGTVAAGAGRYKTPLPRELPKKKRTPKVRTTTTAAVQQQYRSSSSTTASALHVLAFVTASVIFVFVLVPWSLQETQSIATTFVTSNYKINLHVVKSHPVIT